MSKLREEKEELISLGWAKITHPDDIEEDMKILRGSKQAKSRLIQWIKDISDQMAPLFGYI